MPIRKKIAIIDDEKDFCFFVKRNLEDTGEFEVVTAHDGAAGTALVARERPDAILLDVVMPDMGGPDVAEWILGNPETRDIPFIFLTAIVTKDELGSSAMGDIKGHSFIQKPADRNTLITAIRTVIQQNRRDKMIGDILARGRQES